MVLVNYGFDIVEITLFYLVLFVQCNIFFFLYHKHKYKNTLVT